MTSSPALVLLVRHGRTALNDAGLLRGRLDPPLDDVGLAEAERTAHALAPMEPTRIVCSPLARARETAAAIAALTGATPIIDGRLSDRDYGNWAGHAPAELVERYGSIEATPGVEPSAAVTARALAVLEEQRDHLAAGSVVIVAHDVINRFLLHAIDPSLGPTDGIEQHTGCWNLIEPAGPADWRVELVNRY